MWYASLQKQIVLTASCILLFYGFVIGTMPNMLDLYRFVGSPSLRGEGT